MKLHRLHFGNIGPFTDVDPIDFSALSRTGLFLIEGPTGSGKSTIIDAVVFALYGTVAGGGSDAQRLVSSFADLRTAVPFADLAFEVQQGLFRVVRSPRFERPQRHREGATTTQAPKAHLYRLSGRAQIAVPVAELDAPIASGVNEVGVAIRALLGLDHGQFTQTMVLPQGEFTRFLNAKARDRRTLLQDLFDTGVYARIDSELQARRRDTEARFSQTAAIVSQRVAQFVQAARLTSEREQELGEISDYAALRAAVEAHCAEAREKSRAASALHAAAESERQRADGEHAERLAAAKRVSARAQLDQRIAALEAGAEQAQAVDRQLAQLTAAAAPLAAHRAWCIRVRELEEAAAAHSLAAAEVPELAEASGSDVTVAADACAEELQGLQADVGIEEGLAERRAALTSDEAALAALGKGLVSLEQERAELEGKIAELAAELPAVTAQALEFPALTAEVDALTKRRDAALALGPRRQRLEQLQSEAASRLAEVDATGEQVRQLNVRYRAQAAAMLAADLVPGHPCLVCGSVEHPEPAGARSDSDVTDEQISHAEDVQQQARLQFDAAARDVTALSGEIDHLQTLADGSLDDIEEQLTSKAKLQQEARDASERRDAIASSVPALEEELRAIDPQVRERERERMNLEVSLAALRRALGDDEARIDAARAEFPSVRARVVALERRRDLLRTLALSAAELATARRFVDEARVELDRAMADGGIVGDEALAAVAALEPQRDALMQVRDERLQEAAQVEAQLAELRDVDPAAVIDTDESARVLAEAEQALQSAVRAAQETARVESDAAGRAAEIHEATEQLERGRAQAATLLSLAALVSGDRGTGISLPLYAVRRRFREVVDVANQRLSGMLNGRLTLIAHDEPGDGRESVGLALSVRDEVSGQVRDTATVSGGEGFCCALALALGLAEVASAEQGQLRTESLFIDEGFGSLDADTLSEVTAVLESLRGDGRMVAVVSHVAAMQDEIRQRLVVSRVEGKPSQFTLVLP